MTRLLTLCAICFAAALAALPATAQDGGRRMQGGGINYAPQPAIYRVVDVDTYASTMTLRSADGRTGKVYVDSNVYDVSKLKQGDLVRVDFIVPDAMNPRLAAASVWPVQR
jgi:hypothetical protein